MATECQPTQRICDYEGSTYRTDFWEGQGREYEDAVERLALRALLPPRGGRLAELGAGYGRLADLYSGYTQVVLVDYATSQLLQARDRLGHDPRFLFVVADVYSLPLADDTLDVAVTVRLLHHVESLARAFAEIARVTRPGGTYVLEYANKRHLKAILRYLFRRQRASPSGREPYEFVPLNFDFHPAYVADHLRQAGFAIESTRAASLFRLAALKRFLGHRVLAALESPLQRPLASVAVSPSIFVRATRGPGGVEATNPPYIWRCPACGATQMEEKVDGLCCGQCGRTWPLTQGIYDFRVSA